MPRSRMNRLRFGVAVADFNAFITERLLQGCRDEFRRYGIKPSQWREVQVPGAFELPLAALKLAQRKDIDAVIALGAVIRGETFHFELVAQGAALGLSQVSLLTGKPVIFGVVTTDTVKQALARSRPQGDNKGRDGVRAALEMLGALKTI